MTLVYEIEGCVWTFWYCRQKYDLGWATSDSVGCVSSSPAVYKFMIRSGLYERISKISERFGPFVVQYRVRGSASVILSVFVYKVICGNSRTHAVQHRTDSHMSVAYVFCVCVCVCVCGGGWI